VATVLARDTAGVDRCRVMLYNGKPQSDRGSVKARLFTIEPFAGVLSDHLGRLRTALE